MINKMRMIVFASKVVGTTEKPHMRSHAVPGTVGAQLSVMATGLYAPVTLLISDALHLGCLPICPFPSNNLKQGWSQRSRN